MSKNDDVYGFQRGISFEQHVEYIKEAVSLADADVDFSQYDLVYIVPPKNASAITFSPAYIDDTDKQVIADGTPITHGATFGQDMWRWGYKVLNHETLHTFGLPDLYAFEGQGPPIDYHYYVGGWDLMGLISGHAPELLAWHKWKLGWIKDQHVDVVSQSGTTFHHLAPVEKPGGTKMAVVRTGETTAYVIESRRPLRNDKTACDSGVLIYKVDSAAQSGYGPIRIVDATTGGDSTSSCKNIDRASFGVGDGKVSSFHDSEAGVTITVVRQSDDQDYVKVEKEHDFES